MSVTAIADELSDELMQALLRPLDNGDLALTVDAAVLFLRARDSACWRDRAHAQWLCEQSFKPFADALVQHGLRVDEPAAAARYPLVLVLPPRQREEARALLARAVLHATPGGRVLAAVPNAEGAKSVQHDLASLAPLDGCLSKHKCRVFWTRPLPAASASGLQTAWLQLDRPQVNAFGYVSRPGLFAWDRIDPASALLAAHLPDDLHGHAADLGAGYAYLATQLIARCPQIETVDLYEAEARAREPAQRNLQQAIHTSGRPLASQWYWHDVTQGLPRRYDVIVSNPPFHQGRADLPRLGQAFIASAAAALSPRGRLFIVANRHLPYESVMAAHFAHTRTLIEQDGYKVIEAGGAHA